MGMFNNVQVEFDLEACVNTVQIGGQTKNFRIVAFKQPAYEITYEQGILQSVEKINGRC